MISRQRESGRNARESEIQDAIRKELGDVHRYPELVIWRNNSGQMIDAHGNRVFYGVGARGGADLIGIWAGTFVALEIKSTTGKQTPEQQQFEQLVTSKGGVYAVLRSVDDAKQWVEQMRSSR